MNRISINPYPAPPIQNEIDFLVHIGTSAANIVRYVKSAKGLSDENLKTKLGLKSSKWEALAQLQAPLPDNWRRMLREYFI